MDILVDLKGGKDVRGRSYAEELSGHLSTLEVPHTMGHLEFGDIAFIGEGPKGTMAFGMEIKRVPDLLSSIRNGRLIGHQIPGLLATYDQAWLLVEGVYRLSRRTGALELPRGPRWTTGYGHRPPRWSAVEAFLTKVDFQAGIPVRRTRSTFETASLIKVIAGYCMKPYEAHTPLDRMGPPVGAVATPRTLTPAQKLARDWAACLPNVGWTKAGKVLDVGWTAWDVATADEIRWRDALGLGPKAVTAQRIVARIRGEEPS